MKKVLFLSAVLALLTACHSQQKGDDTEERCLVLYYSQTGVSRQLAETVAAYLSVDAVAFDVTPAYDGTYDETIARCREEQEKDSLAALVPLDVNLDDYQVIFLVYPIWFGTYARPIMSLLAATDFTDKTIVPMCTFGSGGLGSSVRALREALPTATVHEGYGVRAARIERCAKEVEEFLIAGGWIEGEVDIKAEYGEKHPVNDEEKAIFAAACDDYPMPIGTPQTVGTRTTANGTDYLFVVLTTLPNGENSEAQVFITCPTDSVPEFTRVDR